jgi:hypothetical protein
LRAGAGPVFSHFEFLTASGNRMTDGEWQQQIITGQRPPHPEWTRACLVPDGEP